MQRTETEIRTELDELNKRLYDMSPRNPEFRALCIRRGELTNALIQAQNQRFTFTGNEAEWGSWPDSFEQFAWYRTHQNGGRA